MKKLFLLLVFTSILVGCSKNDTPAASSPTTDPIYGTWKIQFRTTQTGPNGVASPISEPYYHIGDIHTFDISLAPGVQGYFNYTSTYNPNPVPFIKLNTNTYRFNYCGNSNCTTYLPSDNNVVFYNNNQNMVITENDGNPVPTLQVINKTTYVKQ
jgi:hypothetical protein